MRVLPYPEPMAMPEAALRRVSAETSQLKPCGTLRPSASLTVFLAQLQSEKRCTRLWAVIIVSNDRMALTQAPVRVWLSPLPLTVRVSVRVDWGRRVLVCGRDVLDEADELVDGDWQEKTP